MTEFRFYEILTACYMIPLAKYKLIEQIIFFLFPGVSISGILSFNEYKHLTGCLTMYNHNDTGGKRMNKSITLIAMAALLCISTSGFAQEDKRATLAEELLTLMDIQENIEKSFAAVKRMQMAQFQSMDMPDEGRENVISYQQKIMDFLSQEMSWDKLKTDYISIYAETFSEEEIQGLIDFYKSPIGQKFIEKQPELMERSMRISQKQMMALMPKLKKMTMEAKQEYKKTTVESEEAKKAIEKQPIAKENPVEETKLEETDISE